MERVIGLDLEWGDLDYKSKVWAAVKSYWSLDSWIRINLYSNKDKVQELLQVLEGVPLWLRDKILLAETTKDTALGSMVDALKRENGIDIGLSAEDTWEIGRQSIRLWRIKWVMPALCAQLPNTSNWVWRSLFLDVGFDVWRNKTFEQQVTIMVQHALMSAIYTKRVLWVESARVWILTNWKEQDIKGNDLVQAVQEELRILEKMWFMSYIWYIEWNEITDWEFDVLLTDGHTWNVALKTGEWQRIGLWKEVSDIFKKNGVIGKICWLLLYRSLKKLKKNNDPNEYSLALIIGLKKLIWKIHWSADIDWFSNAINLADQYVLGDKSNGWVVAEIEEDLKLYNESKIKTED